MSPLGILTRDFFPIISCIEFAPNPTFKKGLKGIISSLYFWPLIIFFFAKSDLL